MSDLTGELIDDRYQLTALLATGGMATIYSAIDTRLDRKVAVKIMHPHLAQDEDFVARGLHQRSKVIHCRQIMVFGAW